MTLNEWCIFNKPVLGVDSFIVKIFKIKSWACDDIELITKVNGDTAVRFFGNYPLKRVKINTENSFPRIELMLWPIDKKEEE